ncbi:MAG TPA: MobA/MobL family protein [Steroidobacteraceae bacterium]|nr:MobA/MobL family protein [Steroidobacteraceae bacterium]
MAIYYLGVKSFGRSAGTGGSVSTSAAAYRAGERIRDERSGRIYDHSDRRDVEYKEILLPSQYDAAGAQPDWARDRSQLWNVVERSEPRANARVAREYVVALPHELNGAQRTLLARSFAQEISDRYGNAVDLALHQPRSDPRNFHAHLLSTTREVTPHGLGPKTIAELSGSQRYEMGLPRAMEEHSQIRRLWADRTNEALREAGLEARISHIPESTTELRTDSRLWLPRVAWEIERRGGHSVLGDQVREQFARRQELLQPDVRKTPEEIRNQAVRDWRALRTGADRSLEADPQRQMDSLRRELGRDDFSL